MRNIIMFLSSFIPALFTVVTFCFVININLFDPVAVLLPAQREITGKGIFGFLIVALASEFVLRSMVSRVWERFIKVSTVTIWESEANRMLAQSIGLSAYFMVAYDGNGHSNLLFLTAILLSAFASFVFSWQYLLTVITDDEWTEIEQIESPHQEKYYWRRRLAFLVPPLLIILFLSVVVVGLGADAVSEQFNLEFSTNIVIYLTVVVFACLMVSGVIGYSLVSYLVSKTSLEIRHNGIRESLIYALGFNFVFLSFGPVGSIFSSETSVYSPVVIAMMIVLFSVVSIPFGLLRPDNNSEREQLAAAF